MQPMDGSAPRSLAGIKPHDSPRSHCLSRTRQYRHSVNSRRGCAGKTERKAHSCIGVCPGTGDSCAGSLRSARHGPPRSSRRSG